MISVRLALESDEDAFAALARAATAESLPHLTFHEERCRDVFRTYIDEANPVVWMALSGREPIGLLLAEWGPHGFADGLLAEQRLMYVSPENRGSRATAELISAFKAWAHQLGASEIRLGSLADREARVRYRHAGCIQQA